MRLAVISDIHGNLRALEAVLADIKSRAVDLTVNLGDCVTSPLWPRETFELLQSLALPTVRGNHDRGIEELPDSVLSPAGRFARAALLPEQRRALHSLPPRLHLAEGILAVHGTPDDDSTFLLEEAVEDGRLVPARRDILKARLANAATASVVLCGHSHRQGIALGPNGCLILKPRQRRLSRFRRHPHCDQSRASLPACPLRRSHQAERQMGRGNACAGI